VGQADRRTADERRAETSPRPAPRLRDGEKDLRWNRQHLTSALEQSILQGDSVPEIARRLESVAVMDHKAAIRNARTMVTGAQNAGRDLAYKRAENMGIKLKRVWIATLDGRTRHEHRMLDGQRAKVDEPFKVDGYTIRFPGDPEAEPFLVYNCRCTTISEIEGFETDTTAYRDDPDFGGMTYDEWKKAHPTSSRPITYGEEREKRKKQEELDEYRKLLGQMK